MAAYFSDWIYAVLFFVVFLVLFIWGGSLFQASGLVFRHFKFLRRLDRGPSYWLKVIEESDQALREKGFTFFAHYELRPSILWDGPASLYIHSERNILALLTPSPVLEPENSVSMMLYSEFEEDRWLITLNEGIPFEASEGIDFATSNSISPADQIDYHFERIGKDCSQGRQVKALKFDDPATLIEELTAPYLSSLLRRNLIRSSKAESDACFILTWKGLIRFVFMGFQSQQKGLSYLSARRRYFRSRGETPTLPAELEVLSYQWFEKVWDRATNRLNKTWVFLLSFGFFLASFAFNFDFASLTALCVVIIIHELGHFLAMKFFDYKNISIFFVPFIGAATHGSRREIEIWQENIVILAGPLPGIIISLLTIFFVPNWSANEWISGLVSYGLFLNILNLIPLYPLDGGWLIDNSLFWNRVWLGALFKFLAIVIMFGGALFLGGPIAIVFSLILVMAVPFNYLLGKVRTSFNRIRSETISQVGHDDGQSQLRLIFESIHKTPGIRLSWAHRLPLVRTLASLGNRRPMGRWGQWGWVLMHGFLVTVSLGAGIYGMVRKSETLPSSAYR